MANRPGILMLFALLLAVITVNVELPTGEMQCLTAVPVSYHPVERLLVVGECPAGEVRCSPEEVVHYHPAERVLDVGKCTDLIFEDGFDG